MYKSKEEFLIARKNREEVEEKSQKIIEEKLKNNTYFTTLLENRKKIKELNEKSYALQVELNKLKNEIEKTEQEEVFQKSLQNWNNVITLDSFKHSFNENCYQKVNYDFFQLHSPIVNITIELKERTELKVWKFEVTSVIRNVKNKYEDNINSEVVKFKTKQEALNLVEALKQELFNKYAEEFTQLNNNIKLATEVKKAFEGIDRSYLSNDLQRILKREY